MFHGTFTVELRGALMEVVYRRLIDGDIQWEFCEERLNTSSAPNRAGSGETSGVIILGSIGQ